MASDELATYQNERNYVKNNIYVYIIIVSACEIGIRIILLAITFRRIVIRLTGWIINVPMSNHSNYTE